MKTMKFNIDVKDKEERLFYKVKTHHKLIFQRMMIISFLMLEKNFQEGDCKETIEQILLIVLKVKMTILRIKNLNMVVLKLGELNKIKNN